MSRIRHIATRTLGAACMVLAAHAAAGPIIIDGTDADDHGSSNVSGNQSGWLYIEEGFNNIGGQVSNGNSQVVCLGCNAGDPLNGFNSGFDGSNLGGLGFSRTALTGATALTDYFNNVGPVTLANTAILYMPTDSFQAGGGITDAELAVVNAFAGAINSFVSGPGDPTLGGGLFAHSQVNSAIGFNWLTSLLPGLVVNGDCFNVIGCDDGNLTLTAAGSAAFPNLTDADVDNATPWHGWFTGNLGGLSVLATGLDGQGRTVPVIIGGGAGTTITRNVPEPATILLLGIGLAGIGSMRRKK